MKRKKYFITETDEELKFGDTLEINLKKDVKGGTIYYEGEVVFGPESVGFLVEQGVVEECRFEKEEEEEKDLLDFDEDEGSFTVLSDLIEDFDDLERRVGRLEDTIEKMKPCPSSKKQPKKSK